MSDITDRQREILEYVRQYWKREGEGPTPIQVAEHFKTWPNAIHDVVKVLRRKKYLEESKGKGSKSPLMPTGYRDKIRRALR